MLKRDQTPEYYAEEQSTLMHTFIVGQQATQVKPLCLAENHSNGRHNKKTSKNDDQYATRKFWLNLATLVWSG